MFSKKRIGFILIISGLLIGMISVVFSIRYIKLHNSPKILSTSFSTNQNVTAGSSLSVNPSPNNSWTMLLTGDIIPARTVNQKMTTKNDFSWPLSNISQIIKNADLTLINLESPLIQNCSVTTEGMTFCGDSRFGQSLADSGVDIANLANNHSLNYGWEGLGETEKHLGDVGIETTGYSNMINSPLPLPAHQAGSLSKREGVSRLSRGQEGLCVKNTDCSKFSIKTVKGIKIGLLGYNAISQTVNRDVVERQIKESKSQVDILVVSVHWGKEYEREPIPDAGIAPDDPKELGKLFIDWGADVVVGNHPHWYQRYEFYKDRIIFYALGNTVFDQEWSYETTIGYLVKLTFVGTTTNKDQIEFFPTGLRDFGEAFLLEGEEKQRVLDFLKVP